MPRKRQPNPPKQPNPPAIPAATAEEIALEQKLLDDMRGMTERLRQRNLDNAVLLAQQAARGQGPLVDWFQEIGRRFGETLDEPKRPKLRLVE